jgi:hypothetical protein
VRPGAGAATAHDARTRLTKPEKIDEQLASSACLGAREHAARKVFEGFVKIIEEFRALMCKRDGSTASTHGERDEDARRAAKNCRGLCVLFSRTLSQLSVEARTLLGLEAFRRP